MSDAGLAISDGDERPSQYRGLRPPWKKGEVANPLGRPKGARSKLSEAFYKDLAEKWQASGPDVIDRVIRDEPATFLRVVAAVMPKELHIVDQPAGPLSEADMHEMLATIRELIRQKQEAQKSAVIEGEVNK